MPQSYHRPQEYSFHAALVEFAEVADDHLCGAATLSFFVGLLLVAGIAAAAGLAALMGV